MCSITRAGLSVCCIEMIMVRTFVGLQLSTASDKSETQLNLIFEHLEKFPPHSETLLFFFISKTAQTTVPTEH